MNSVDNYLIENLEKYLQELERLCAQPSVSARQEGIAECAELVKAMFEARGLQAQIIPTAGSPVVVGRLSGRSPRTLLFYNHYDVQPPEPLELWTTPPFQPSRRNGKLYARGVCDDKGELVARLAALDAVRQAHHGELPCSVVFVTEGEEEVASPNIARFVLEHKALLQAHGAIWEGGGVDTEGCPGTLLGYRGILYVELSIETMSRDAHSGMANILPNAAWRLLRALMTLKGPDERILIPGFTDDALPPSALDLELLATMPDDDKIIREAYGLESFVNNLSGIERKKAVFQNTCNIAGFTAGYQGPGVKTVIPHRATAKVDFRLVPDQDPEDILVKLRRHLDQQGFGDVKVEKLGAMWPSKTQADDPLVRLAKKTAEQVYQKPYRMVPLAGGSSPAYAFARPLGISVIDAGIGYWDNRVHAPDEHIRIEDFLLGARHIAHILDEFADLPM